MKFKIYEDLTEEELQNKLPLKLKKASRSDQIEVLSLMADRLIELQKKQTMSANEKKEYKILEANLASTNYFNATTKEDIWLGRPTDKDVEKNIKLNKEKYKNLSKEELIDKLAKFDLIAHTLRKELNAAQSEIKYFTSEFWFSHLKSIIDGKKISRKKTSVESFHGKKYQIAVNILNELRPNKDWIPKDFLVFQRKIERSGNKLAYTTAKRYFEKITGIKSTKIIK